MANMKITGMGRAHQSMAGAGENHAREIRSARTSSKPQPAPATPPVNGRSNAGMPKNGGRSAVKTAEIGAPRKGKDGY
jgi:hypothetical protein